MRGVLVSMLMLATVLAGCGSNSGTPTTYVDCGSGLTPTRTAGEGETCIVYEDCEDAEAQSEISSEPGHECVPVQNTTPPLPNVPPILVVKTLVGGTASNVSFVGQNVTIDASGSSDPDADGLLEIAVGAQDSNKTYTPQYLYLNGAFHTANFTFSRAGVVNITAVAVDKRNDANGSTVVHLKQFVDAQSRVANPVAMPLIVPGPVALPTKCTGPTGQSAPDAQASYQGTFELAAGATFVHAKVAAGNAAIAICDPSGKAISPAGGDVTTPKGTALPPPTGTTRYYVEVYSSGQNQAAGAVTVDISVHYEPQP